MSNKKQYEKLVRRYVEDKASPEELEVVFDLLDKGILQPYIQKAMKRFEEKERPASVLMMNKWKYLARAAIVTGLLGIGGVWLFRTKTVSVPAIAQIHPSIDKAPGYRHARLMLPGGSTLDLDSSSTPVLQLQNGTRIARNSRGEWAYHPAPGKNIAITYNTLSAPRGGQFSFLLEDGTRVWLNAASSLRFPAKFAPDSRVVTLTGEAYFEVAADSHAPFLVKAGNTVVNVLGTHFDVNAYPDEPVVRTTLLEGSVRVNSDHAAVLMHSGQQTSTGPGGEMTKISNPELAQAAIAWKEGFFSFGEDHIQTVMRQLSRWYNVDVHYEGPVTTATFGGDIGRDLSLMQVLKLLEKSQVHFRLEGNTLTVLP